MSVAVVLAALSLGMGTDAFRVNFDPGEFEWSAPMESVPSAFSASMRLMPQVEAAICSIPGMAVSAGDFHDNGFSLRLQPVEGGYVPQFVLAGTNSCVNVMCMTEIVKPGHWARLTGTWDGNLACLYADGRLIARESFKGKVVAPADGRIQVGRQGGGYGYYPFAPKSFLFLPRALSPGEVQDLSKGEATEGSDIDLRRAAVAWRLLRGMPISAGDAFWASGDNGLHPSLRRLASAAADVHRVRRILDRPKDWKRPSASIYVSPCGRDENPGTADRPFATLERAQREVRARKVQGLPLGGLSVVLKAGRYDRQDSLVLEADDSGDPDRPVVWRAGEKGAVELSGGWTVTGLKPWRGKILVTDVKAAGYPHWGERYPKEGRKIPRSAVTDLCQDGIPLTVARTPNAGFAIVPSKGPYGSWAQAGFPYDSTRGADFECTLDGLANLANEPDLMARGYFDALWSDESSFVKIDAWARRAVLVDSHEHVQEFSPYYLFNALPLLDAPGEWFLDRSTGLLYVWPREGGTGRASFVLTSLDDPLVRMRDVHDVRFEDIRFRYGRGDAIFATNVLRVAVHGCDVCCFGGRAVSFEDACEVTLLGNRVKDVGYHGLTVTGGDRRTLTPAGNLIAGNDISQVSLHRRTYTPALQIEGVGCIAYGNHLHDVPSSVARLEGNDHVFRRNLVERAATESDDQGAVDIYLDPTYAGCQFVENVWVDIGRNPAFQGSARAAIRFDGNVSGMTVERNRFIRCGDMLFGAINVNGGRHNTIRDCIFEDCAKGITTFPYSPRRWKEALRDKRVIRAFASVDVTQWPYLKYPWMSSIRTSDQVNYYIGNFTRGTCVLIPSAPDQTVMIGNGSEADGGREPEGVPTASDVLNPVLARYGSGEG